MTKDDIACYRKNYDKKLWTSIAKEQICQPGMFIAPLGILDAVLCLCAEVERLKKWKKKGPERGVII